MQYHRFVEALSESIVHVAYAFSEQMPPPSVLIDPTFQAETVATPPFALTDDSVTFLKHGAPVLTESARALTPKQVTRCIVDGAPRYERRQTPNGEVSVLVNAREEPAYTAFAGELTFAGDADELLLGLGQYEDGLYDLKNRTEYLYQSNMRIALPFWLSSRGYAVLVDTQTDAVFANRDGTTTFRMDAVDGLSYYVLLGDSVDSLIASLRRLTGRASMLPRWATGYIQSKEHYASGDELLAIAEEFHRRDIPLACVVQDWLSWPDGQWGQKTVDPARYPHLRETIERLHALGTRLMLSIWPNMSPSTPNHQAFREANLLLPNSEVYDAFQPEGRALYGAQCAEQLLPDGLDAWWCDNAEPFSDADWYGETRRPEDARRDLVVGLSKRCMPWEQINSYGLYHAMGIADQWRAINPRKRLVNLTRSSYISGQRYGTILWSGDICARWDVLRKQIAEGVKMGLCGMPYWTLDVGGFFVVGDAWQKRGCGCNGNPAKLWFWRGDYDDGVADRGYQELYTRWLEFGAFLPVFRSHGTDTPREPWRFEPPFADAIVKFIRLRDRLTPYVYSCFADAHFRSGTIMRGLIFDFADDPDARARCDSYMFGPSLLIAPVTEPMYYRPHSQPIADAPKTRRVYLPAGTDWYDFWTNERHAGGQTIVCDAPIDRLPVFVRAGAILPFGDGSGAIDELRVYRGASGSFTLYQDDGDGDVDATARCAFTTYRYDDATGALTVADHRGDRPAPESQVIYI